jgi:hypothetical protein
MTFAHILHNTDNKKIKAYNRLITKNLQAALCNKKLRRKKYGKQNARLY